MISVALCAFSVSSVSESDVARSDRVANAAAHVRMLSNTEDTEKAQRATEKGQLEEKDRTTERVIGAADAHP